MVGSVLPSTPLLGFTGRAFHTTTDSSATSHPHKPWLSPCTRTSESNIGTGVRLPQLLHWLPVTDATLKHLTGLTEYRALRYFARLPTCQAESGSLALCACYFLWLPSDLAVSPQRPCHSDYLPLSRGDSGFLQPDGFASFAGQTKKAANAALKKTK